ncbi:unnamed protein product [Spirodela intermedia]|uniref:Uncharacterized protein n=1 Tax=Spirodela intermedia TaxID=51605 RepID=A0A7I8KS87_SPIIN|nr:unnamed protein product [Spirodela intermedia]
MGDSYLPLRWESTGDQWWYASPIDWAAANGHYDLVRELLHIDNNLLIKLTSLRRIRRLETVWDDDARFAAAARCRSEVARSLLLECETKNGKNSLIRAGYGGWLMYSAASAGDMRFLRELLDRDPLLVFGEGEYGVSDILYAAARSKSSEVFRLLLDFAVSPRCPPGGAAWPLQESPGDNILAFRWEMVNRAAHAAARGGNLEILLELLSTSSDPLEFRDVHGSSVLHAAAGRGQVEVVKGLVPSLDIVDSRDYEGNTALHVAAFRGQLPVLEALMAASPSSAASTNNGGDTILHLAVAGFRTSGFRRLDRQLELVRRLAAGDLVNLEEMLNARNGDGRTALHLAVAGDVPAELVELLVAVPSIDLNVQDVDGSTALDLLRRRPRSASTEILIRRVASAGGVSSSLRPAAVAASSSSSSSQLKGRRQLGGFPCSPGTAFRIPDGEMFLFTGLGGSDAGDGGSRRSSSCSSEPSSAGSSGGSSAGNKEKKTRSSVHSAAKHLKFLFTWPRRKARKAGEVAVGESGDDDSSGFRTPLRQRFSQPAAPSLHANKRVLAPGPSPSTKEKLADGTTPQSSPAYSVSRSSASAHSDQQKGVCFEDEANAPPSCSKSSSVNGTPATTPGGGSSASQGLGSLKTRLVNRYLCFGAQGLAVPDPRDGRRSSSFFRRPARSPA